MPIISSLLPAIKHLSMIGYWLVLLISLAESLAFVGVIIPGGILIIFSGFLSAQGYLDLGDLIWFAAIGAILGDSLSYWLGNKGSRFFCKENTLFKLGYLEKGEQFFKKHGDKSILLSRFISPLRPIMPFIAGLFRMKQRSFLFWNILGGFLWAAAYLLLGYFFGGAIGIAEAWSTRIGFFTLVIISVSFVIWFLIKKGRPIYLFLASIANSIKNAIVSNPDVKRIVHSHPYVFTFIKRRFSREKFSGLPLSLLLLAFIYISFLFLGVMEDIITADPMVAADIRVANLFLAFRDMGLIKFFTWVTLLGKWQIVTMGAIVMTILLWLWRRRVYIIPLWLMLIGSEIFNQLGKLAFHRSRPDVAYYAERGFSFPSGHATVAVAFYGFLTYILSREIKQWKHKATIISWGLIVILAIGLSRLYIGVHYVSDVWAGYLSGLLLLIIGITLVEWIINWRAQPIYGLAPIKTKLVSGILILVQLGFYIFFALHYNPPLRVSENKPMIIVESALHLFQQKSEPQFTETIFGDKQEPINLIIIAKNDEEFRIAMNRAGWQLADKATLATISALAKSAILNEAYPTAPITPSFWNTNPHDFGFEKQTEAQNVRQRHHARFWKTNFEISGEGHAYVGTASFDSGLKWFVTHKINPDIDTERELIFTDLLDKKLIATSTKASFISPILGKNFSGDAFFTDGKIYQIFLKEQ